jgi:hypothetical protein
VRSLRYISLTACLVAAVVSGFLILIAKSYGEVERTELGTVSLGNVFISTSLSSSSIYVPPAAWILIGLSAIAFALFAFTFFQCIPPPLPPDSK